MTRSTLLLLMPFLPLAAQNASITGTVIDPQLAPIPMSLSHLPMWIWASWPGPTPTWKATASSGSRHST